MPVELQETDEGRVLEVRLTGKLAKMDYETFGPAVERLVKRHGKIRLLVLMHNFHGWTAGALWEDTKFAVQHFRDFDRLAMVGEKKWQKGMTAFCQPFTTAAVRYFEQTEAAAARQWLAVTAGPAAGQPGGTGREPGPRQGG